VDFRCVILAAVALKQKKGVLNVPVVTRAKQEPVPVAPVNNVRLANFVHQAILRLTHVHLAELGIINQNKAKRRAYHASPVRTKTPLDNLRVNSALKILKANKQIPPLVVRVVMAPNQNPVVPNVPNAMRVKQVLALVVLVMCATLVNTVRAACLLCHVLNVQLVQVKAIKDKRRVSNAVPVNSMTLLGLSSVNFAVCRPTLVAKEETAVVLIAPSVGRRKRVVLNVSRVVRVHLAMGA
jgi:hypothetical protein